MKEQAPEGRTRRAGRVVFGDERRIGLWIVPLMAIVTLAGAVVAAGVTILVYNQRVEALREEVGGASAAADEARGEIERLVEDYRVELGLAEPPDGEEESAPTDRGPTDAGIFANNIEVISNTNVATYALASIKQTSMGSDTTVMGSSSDGYIGMSSATRVGMHSETAISMDSETFVGLASSVAVALKSEAFVGIHMSAAAGMELQLNSMTMFGPPSPTGPSPGTMSPGAFKAAKVVASLAGVGSVGSSIMGLMGLDDQYDTAAAELNAAAAKAAEAGLPALAARLSRLSSKATGSSDGAATGAVIGGVIGGPIGAAVGAGIGGVVSSPSDPGGSTDNAGDASKLTQKEQSEFGSSKDKTSKDWDFGGGK